MKLMQTMLSNKKNKNNMSRRRFDDEQIKILETMFESEARPELRTKQQMANKLGLQPRQVAIWFQNKRARSKSKQIEDDYSMLKINYDHLASKIESLKKENQSLLIQVQILREIYEQRGDEECERKDYVPKIDDTLKFLAGEHELGMALCSEKSEKMEYLEEEDILNMAQIGIADGSLTSDENNRYNFETSEFLEWDSVNTSLELFA